MGLVALGDAVPSLRALPGEATIPVADSEFDLQLTMETGVPFPVRLKADSGVVQSLLNLV